METVAGSDVLRVIYPRVLARTLAFTRSLPDAEDAVQEAVLRALRTWPDRGTPDSPEAWLVTVATNVHRDRQRRGRFERADVDALESLAQLSPWVRIAMGSPEVHRGWKDELLRLLFACCHPALQTGESAALALATVVGLSTREIAAAFLAEPRTMEQRLTRARRRLRERGDADGTVPDASRDRLDAVLWVLFSLFNEGYWSTSDEAPIRADLCRLALGLGHSLLEAFPDEPEAAGLLALMILHDARRDSRHGPAGEFVPLPDQDRQRWDRAAIGRATALLDRALSVARPGPLQIEAAISAVHCRADCAEATDWNEIAALYAALEEFRATPGVRVNRAFAVARAEGPLAGLSLLDVDETLAPDHYHYTHLVRGTLLAELDRRGEAVHSLRRALAGARNAAERSQIERRIAQLTEWDEA